MTNGVLLEDLLRGGPVYTVPWSIAVDESDRLWIHPVEYNESRSPYGTATVRVARDRGALTLGYSSGDVKSFDREWRCTLAARGYLLVDEPAHVAKAHRALIRGALGPAPAVRLDAMPANPSPSRVLQPVAAAAQASWWSAIAAIADQTAPSDDVSALVQAAGTDRRSPVGWADLDATCCADLARWSATVLTDFEFAIDVLSARAQQSAATDPTGQQRETARLWMARAIAERDRVDAALRAASQPHRAARTLLQAAQFVDDINAHLAFQVSAVSAVIRAAMTDRAQIEDADGTTLAIIGEASATYRRREGDEPRAVTLTVLRSQAAPLEPAPARCDAGSIVDGWPTDHRAAGKFLLRLDDIMATLKIVSSPKRELGE